jgi:hypothetical protein
MHEEDLISESYLDNSYEEYTEEDLVRDLSYDNSRNVIINKFTNFTEIVVYKEIARKAVKCIDRMLEASK